MWPDNETADDLLGFRVHAELIRSVVTDPKQLPVTMGLFADWGGGKSSLMKILERDLDPETWPEGSSERTEREKIACLYFNGWLFEGYDDAKSAILTAILLSLGENKRFGPKVRGKVAALLKSVNWMRVARLGFKHVAVPAIAAYATGGASVVPGLLGSAAGAFGLPWWGKKGGEAEGKHEEDKADKDAKGGEWEDLIKKDDSHASPMDVRTFREKFGELLKECRIDSLVILIDDLDRCSPERIIENLEAIKLFLNVHNTAFVIGADPRIVRHAIDWRYSQDGGGVDFDKTTREGLVNDYLEKLIQVPYRLPRLSPAEIESYMTLLFCYSLLPDDLNSACRTACDKYREGNRYGAFGFGAVRDALKKEPPATLADALAFCASSAPLITEGLKGNPRQVKRFLNAFHLRRKLAEIAKLSNVKDAVLVKLMILEYSEEKLFMQLFGWQAAQNGQPEELRHLEAQARGSEEKGKEAPKEVDPRWATSFAQRWLQMEPPLAPVDLRDYFWVARDRLESTLANVSMVPPIVRRAFEGLLTESTALIGPAIRSVKEFKDAELAALFGLIEQHVKRQPSERSGFNALRQLVEAGINGAGATFSNVLVSNPLDVMPAAVGMDVMTLAAKKPETAPALQPAIDRLMKSDTKIGKAAQTAKKPGK